MNKGHPGRTHLHVQPYTIYLLADNELPRLASLWWTAPLQIWYLYRIGRNSLNVLLRYYFPQNGMDGQGDRKPQNIMPLSRGCHTLIKMDSSMTCYVQMAICRCALSYHHRTCKSPTEEFPLRQLWQEAKYWHTINTLWRNAVQACRGFCEGRSK